jgi:hypothetical protein
MMIMIKMVKKKKMMKKKKKHEEEEEEEKEEEEEPCNSSIENFMSAQDSETALLQTQCCLLAPA